MMGKASASHPKSESPHKHNTYIPNKNTLLTQNSWDFDDLRTIVAKFCSQDLRIFPQIYWDWKADSTNLFAFCMYDLALPFLSMQSLN